MQTQVETNTVTLTPAAVQAMRDMLAQRNLDGAYALRVFVAGRTCSGLQYGMTLDNNPRETDLTFETDGVKILVDDYSILYMHGSRIDFIDDKRGKGFLVENPNDLSSCSSSGCSSCEA